MAQSYKIHTKSQKQLYKEYRNLLRRTKRFKGTHTEVTQGVTYYLEKARDYLRLNKLAPKDTAYIKKLTKNIHELRGKKLEQEYIKKTRVDYDYDYYDDNITVSDDYVYDIIIANYKDTLTRICTMPSGTVVHTGRGKGYGLDELLMHLDNAIANKGKKDVADMINLYEPPYGLGWFYDSIEHFGFITRIMNGEFDVESDLTDEEIEQYYE